MFWIGILLFAGFLTVAIYSLWAMYVIPQAFSLYGFAASGFLGGVLAFLVDGYNHISLVVTRAMNMTATWGEYVFVAGLVFAMLVLTWNCIVTKGRTLVR